MNTMSAPLAQKAAAVVETVTAERCYAHSQTVMQLSAQLQPPQPGAKVLSVPQCCTSRVLALAPLWPIDDSIVGVRLQINARRPRPH